MHDLPTNLHRNNEIFQTQSLARVNSKGAQTFSCDSCITVKSPNLWQLISHQNMSTFKIPNRLAGSWTHLIDIPAPFSDPVQVKRPDLH